MPSNTLGSQSGTPVARCHAVSVLCPGGRCGRTAFCGVLGGRGAEAGPCAGSLSAALMAPHPGQPPAASGAPPPCPPRAPRAAGISPWPSLSYSCVRGLIPPELLGSEPHAAAFPEPSLISGENDLSALLPTSRIGPRLRHRAPRGAACTGVRHRHVARARGAAASGWFCVFSRPLLPSPCPLVRDPGKRFCED